MFGNTGKLLNKHIKGINMIFFSNTFLVLTLYLVHLQ